MRRLLQRLRWKLFSEQERFMIGFGLGVIDESGPHLDALRRETNEFMYTGGKYKLYD